ncbi:MAG: hypothetical protein KAJ10_07710 [Thermodesulfovibrionia bacterium]|nr:hypothetical protein [Thermodesulfovibrionia bacterium]
MSKNEKKETTRAFSKLNDACDLILKSEEASSNISGDFPQIPKRPPKK